MSWTWSFLLGSCSGLADRDGEAGGPAGELDGPAVDGQVAYGDDELHPLCLESRSWSRQGRNRDLRLLDTFCLELLSDVLHCASPFMNSVPSSAPKRVILRIPTIRHHSVCRSLIGSRCAAFGIQVGVVSSGSLPAEKR